MILNSIIAAFLTLQTTPVSSDPYVTRVECREGKGSGFVIAPSTIVTANHVVDNLPNEVCSVYGGKPARIVYKNPQLDYAILVAETPPGALEIDCSGFQSGSTYMGAGYPSNIYTIKFGIPTGTLAEPWTNPSQWRGQATLSWPDGSYFIPGMSGGYVKDIRTGKVVGIVTGYNWVLKQSISRALRDTHLCYDFYYKEKNGTDPKEVPANPETDRSGTD